jgi:hypothetical protein
MGTLATNYIQANQFRHLGSYCGLCTVVVGELGVVDTMKM